MPMILDPNWQRGYLIPYGRDKRTGQGGLAVPGVVQDMLSALMLPGDVYQGKMPILDPQTGRTSDAVIRGSADLAGMMTLGSGAIPADKNSLRMGIKAYHGSPNKIDGLPKTARAIETKNAVFAATNPDVAETFRYPREYGSQVFEDAYGNPIDPGDMVTMDIEPRYPYVLPEAQAQRFIDDTAYQGQVIDNARRKAHDAVIARNVLEGIDERSPGDVYAVLDEKIMRPEQKGVEGLPLFDLVKKYGVAALVAAGVLDQAQGEELKARGYN